MEIVNFFKKQEGRWFSQKTTHYLQAGKSKAGKSDLEVAYIAAHDPELPRLVQDPVRRRISFASGQPSSSNTVGGLRISHNSVVGPQNQIKTLLIAAVGDSEGQLLQRSDNSVVQISRYRWENGALIVTTEADGLIAEERWWFITDNIRMRTSVVHSGEQQTLASFCSEIRLGDVKADAKA